jgi:hypothetical protein
MYSVVFLFAPIIGVALGLKFRLLVLGPAVLVAAGLTAMVGISDGYSAGLIALWLFEVLAALQLGYFLGCFIAEYRSIQAASTAPQVTMTKRGHSI